MAAINRIGFWGMLYKLVIRSPPYPNSIEVIVEARY